jgi:hypothetical protein
LEQYESLRRQALEPGDSNEHNGLELAFIERWGLAAWIEGGLPFPVGSAKPTDGPTPALRETEPVPRDLVLALADLVLGDRQEAQDGRSD